jgi:hypothetical protein
LSVVWCTCGLAIFSLRRSMQCIFISENWHKSPCMVLCVQRLWFRTELVSWNNRNNCATYLTVFQPNVLGQYHSHLKGLQYTYIPICGTFPARRETVQSSNLCCLPSSDANEAIVPVLEGNADLIHQIARASTRLEASIYTKKKKSSHYSASWRHVAMVGLG